MNFTTIVRYAITNALFICIYINIAKVSWDHSSMCVCVCVGGGGGGGGVGGDWVPHVCDETDCVRGGWPCRGWWLCFPLCLHAGGSGLGHFCASGLDTSEWVGWCLVLWLWSGPPDSDWWFSFASAFHLFLAAESSLLLCLCLRLIFKYVLGDVVLVGWRPFTRTEQMYCVCRGGVGGKGCGRVELI